MVQSNSRTCDVKKRNSSIEFIKVISIVLIIISHVIQTLGTNNPNIPYSDYVIDISNATSNIQYLLLALLRNFGPLGNSIFFVCSAWFLLESKRSSNKKILQMILDVWVISVLLFIIVYDMRNGNLGIEMIIKQFFPTTFSNNWYITCYLIFYALHPFINIVIYRIDQSSLFRCTFVLSFLYIGCNYIVPSFFETDLILWITIYFIIAYLKFYLPRLTKNVSLNLFFAATGLIGHICIVLFTNFLGLRFYYLHDKLLHWNKNCSPFTILLAISIFNISQNIHFENNIINNISRMSFLVYIIHENNLLAYYYRPLLWNYVYNKFGYNLVVGWVFLLAILIFLFSLLASTIYKNTLQRFVIYFVDMVYPIWRKWYIKAESIVLQIH
ncbi:acyltransferase family protein [Allofournierella sp. CML151]|uniref:acyltransferase family protein n=1 Tax=Allofournierella sp. CML151 TaxID=2998082 RepID=UPI003FA44AEF